MTGILERKFANAISWNTSQAITWTNNEQDLSHDMAENDHKGLISGK